MDTDNPIILRRTKNSNTIICMQRKADKIVPTEESIIAANKLAFNDDIGTVTNRVTTMIEIQSNPNLTQKQYDELSYRIKTGQHFQQTVIDRAKGIIAKPMPEEWHNRRANIIKDDDTTEEIETKEFNMSIVADRKPYFMIYVYPHLKKEYDTYYSNANFKAKALYSMSIDEMNNASNLNEEEQQFIDYYNMLMPVGCNPCVINRISWIFEDTFNGYLKSINDASEFDYSILKSDTEYSQRNYNEIKNVYKEYLAKVENFKKRSSTERIEDAQAERRKLVESFKKQCELICTNEDELCNIVLDLCYKTENSKQFAWDICAPMFIKNLFKKNGYSITYPELSQNWNFKYMGYGFEMKTMAIDEELI